MNALQFYEEYKTALNYLGPGWADREQVNVWIEEGKFCMSFEDRELRIVLPTVSPE